MKLSFFYFLLITAMALLSVTSCNSQNKSGSPKNNSTTSTKMKTTPYKYQEGKDYTLFERVRVLDKVGFSQPVEAFSLLIPKGWKSDGGIIWNQPGTTCAGTNLGFKAVSSDGKYSFEMFPQYMWAYNSDPQMAQYYQNSGSPYCGYGQPMDAANYFKQAFAIRELGNPQIIEIKANATGLQAMEVQNNKTRQELMSYGASQVMFYPSAISAKIKWNDGSEGIVVCGVTIIETTVPNPYNGSYSKIYTSSATEKVVFKYPASESENAPNMLSVIMSSIRTNTNWKNTVDNFWKNVRQQKHIAHIGTIKMLDDQTAQMGRDAIKKGQQNLANMDNNMRSWEASQQSQDHIRTNFVKAIREVETYRDETGVVELNSGYNHAWSRSDGSSFIMSDNPNFDPSSVLQDQRWKEMKRVQQ